MKALLLPVILLLLGVGSGVGAGLFLMPEPEDPMVATDCADPNEMTQAALPTTVDVTTEREFAKLNNQFIIPVVEEGMVSALVVMSLNLEVTVGSGPAIFTAKHARRWIRIATLHSHQWDKATALQHIANHTLPDLRGIPQTIHRLLQ